MIIVDMFIIYQLNIGYTIGSMAFDVHVNRMSGGLWLSILYSKRTTQLEQVKPESKRPNKKTMEKALTTTIAPNTTTR